MPHREVEWHDGELAMHKLLRAPTHHNPTNAGLPPQLGYRVMHSPIVAFGTLDAQGRPWTTVWGSERGFARPIAEDVIGVNSSLDAKHDPVFQALWAGHDSDVGEVVRHEGAGKPMAGLAIDLATRDRVKLAGTMIAGALTARGEDGAGEAQMALHVDESLGNCPKYLNKRDIQPHAPVPVLVSDTLPLPKKAVELIHRADLFFMSSTNGQTMDTNHRGGAPGFVRIVRNDEGGVELVYPEFSGNRLYQSLGNLQVKPLAGLVFPDFETSDVLYLTGEASILVGPAASALLPHTKLAVRIAVTAARFVQSGLPFRGSAVDYSPYNPPVRALATEGAEPTPSAAARITATLRRREVLTPTVARFVFGLDAASGPAPAWRPGQHVTLDFAPELDLGYSHMRDDDPLSLNDDFVRTFTVSGPRPSADGAAGAEMEITARRGGPATTLLWRQNPRVPLEVPVLGFGGAEGFRLPTRDGAAPSVFVAGGVGITPLLAQAPDVLAGGAPLRVLWSLRAEDVPLAVDSFERNEGLAAVTAMFVTGAVGEETRGQLEKLRRMGAEVAERRMGRSDVLDGDKKRKFFSCAGLDLLKLLRVWLAEEDHVWEDFGY